jgi:hypothetical protein
VLERPRQAFQLGRQIGVGQHLAVRAGRKDCQVFPSLSVSLKVDFIAFFFIECRG